MKTLLILIFVLFFQQVPAEGDKTDSYIIDTGHTFVTFEVKRFDMLDVVSTFRDVTGTITMNPDNISETKTDIVIKTASLESGNLQRDNTVKSPNFCMLQSFLKLRLRVTRLKIWVINGLPKAV